MLTVTGYSDDLIEIEGDITEEIDVPYNDQNGYIAFSDGTLLKVVYDGLWRFFIVNQGPLFDHKVDGIEEDDTFDIVHFKTGIKWLLYSPGMHHLARKEKNR